MATVTFEIQDSDAWALAQFVKRVGYSDCLANAVDKDEAFRMINGLEAVRKGMGDAGYAPR